MSSPGDGAAVRSGVVHLACAMVLFDCDGVLVDSDASVELSWTRWAEAQGLDPRVVVALAHGRRAADTVAMTVEPAERAAALDLVNRFELEDAARVTPVPGAAALLAGIPRDRWAVVTSGTTALARARLAAAGLPLPDLLVTADDVARGKPDPEGYLGAAGRTPLRSTVVVEDSASGVQAGRAAGAGHVLGVGERALATDAEPVVADLTAVRWTDTGLDVDRAGMLRVPSAARPTEGEGPDEPVT